MQIRQATSPGWQVVVRKKYRDACIKSSHLAGTAYSGTTPTLSLKTFLKELNDAHVDNFEPGAVKTRAVETQQLHIQHCHIFARDGKQQAYIKLA